MNIHQIAAKEVDVKRRLGNLTNRFMAIKRDYLTDAERKTFSAELEAIEAERKVIEAERKNYESAMKMSGLANAKGYDTSIETKAVPAGPSSPLQFPRHAWEQMFNAARSGLKGYAIELASHAGDVQVKSPLSESGLGGPPWATQPTGLPPVIAPELTQSLLYEPDRLASHLINATMDGPALEYLVHSGNTNPAAVAPELSTKVDLGMQLTTRTAFPVVIACLTSVSLQALADFNYFVQWIPNEMQKALTDAETDQIANGTGTSGSLPGFVGIMNTSGVLTRAMGSSTPLDAILNGINDLRVGSSFAEANLIALHPDTLTFLKEQKDAYGRYLLNPTDPTEATANSIWGIRCVQNTYIPLQTAIIMDTTKAAMYWTREGVRIEMNQWGDSEWTTNSVSFRAEMRTAFGVLRPTAINIVTGLV